MDRSRNIFQLLCDFSSSSVSSSSSQLGFSQSPKPAQVCPITLCCACSPRQVCSSELSTSSSRIFIQPGGSERRGERRGGGGRGGKELGWRALEGVEGHNSERKRGRGGCLKERERERVNSSEEDHEGEEDKRKF